MRLIFAGCLLALAAAPLATCSGQVPTPSKADGDKVKLPGITIDFANGCVDLEGEICLDEGALELVACAKGTKEHESIVALAARPMHIHTALLLLGANNGNPAMQKPADEAGSQWIHLQPRGDAIDVFLVMADANGKQSERPIGDFIKRLDETLDAPPNERQPRDAEAGGKPEKFPHTFLFAGSHLEKVEEATPPRYLADQSGDVISIVTFGDEVLCLPESHSDDNAALMWQVDPTHLPKVGSKVTLRLRPQKKVIDGNTQ